MGAQEIANFILKLDDQLTTGAVRAANSVLSLGSKAKDATKAIDQMAQSAKASGQALAADLGKASKALQQNSLVSEVETLASLLIQVGGNASKAGILISSMARPVAIAGSVFGGMTLAVGGSVAALGLLALGVRSAINSTEEWISEAAMVRESLIAQRDLTVDGARNLVDYAGAVSKLETESAKLEVSLADGLAPAFKELTDASTGAVRILSALGIEAKTTDSSMSGLLKTVGAVMAWTPAGVGALSWGTILGNYAEIGRGGGVNYDANYGPQLPTNFDERELERLRGMGAGPEYDLNAISARNEAERQKEKADAEAMARREEAAMQEAWNIYHATQDDIRKLIKELDRIAKDSPAAVFESAGIQDRAEKAAKEKAQQLQDEEDLAKFEAEQKAQRIQAANTTASALTGGDVSSIVSSMGGGPWGAVFSAISSGAAYDSLENLFDQVLEIYTDLPEQIGRIAGELVPSLIRAAPEMASAFVVLGPAIVKELVIAAPEILKAVVDAIIDLPSAMVEALADLFTVEIGGKEVGLGNIDKDSRGARAIGGAVVGGFFGGPLGAAAGAGIGALTGRGKGGGIQIGQIVAPNPRDLIRQLRQIQGSYGFGEDLGVAF